MESNCGRLKQYLADFLAVLISNDSGPSGNETTDSEPPRMELIDFDELSAVLREIITELESVNTMKRERAIIRQWFIDRIVSLDRGRQAVLGALKSENDAAFPDTMPLPELVRRFEEAAARLRSTASTYNPAKNGVTYRMPDSLKPFKS